MHENMHLLLNAYLDGELHGRQLVEMQNHLASCETCRNELEELRRVSVLLKTAPAPASIPAERFISQMTLTLPRRTLSDKTRRSGSLVWWLVPGVLLGAWIFLQTVFALTDAVTVANLTGLLGKASSWLAGGQVSLWYSVVEGLMAGQTGSAPSTISLLNNVSVFGGDLLGGFLWQAAIVLLYWVWLGAWWLRRGLQPTMSKSSNG